ISYGNEDDSSFRAHWDTRDVFVLQLVGRKKWILYEPNFEYPLPSQQSKDMEHVVKCPTTEPYMDVILEEGDLLYVPRGWWHDPVPCGERTVHLSVGTYAIYRNDYLHWIIQNILPSYPEARMHLDS
ncbi:JmjC domain-containing protein, partial [Acinetobacter baumannii]|nr:cupin-like domain-containing protein [Acinetobacter baumannii]